MRARNFDRYSVETTTMSRKESVLLGNKKKGKIAKGGNALRRFVAGTVMALMVTSIAYAGVVATAPEAHAEGFVEKSFNATFCTSWATDLGVENVSVLKPSTKPTDGVPTAYEKYGMSGMAYSHVFGFAVDEKRSDTISSKGGWGEGASNTLNTALEGDANSTGLNQWAAASKGQIDERPGLHNTKQTCGNAVTSIPTAISNFTLWLAKISTWFSGNVYQFVFDPSNSVFTILEKPVTQLVFALKDKLFFEFLMPLVMVAALMIGYQGLIKKRSTNAISGVIWVIVAMAVAVAALSNPMFIPKKVNEVTIMVSGAGMSALTSGTSDSGNLCKVGGKKGKPTYDENIRLVQCNLWESFVYTPWVIGQFGKTPAELTATNDTPNGFTARLGGNIAYQDPSFTLDVLKAKDGKPLTIRNVKLGNSTAAQQNWALYLLDHRSNWDDAEPLQQSNKVRGQMTVYANQLGAKKFNESFKGSNGVERPAVAGVAVAGSLLSGILIITIGISVFIMDIGLVVLTVMSPIFFLLGVLPGPGQKVARKYFGTILSLAIKRVAVSIYLGVIIAMLQMIIVNTHHLPLFGGQLMIILVGAAGFYFRKPTLEMFDGFMPSDGIGSIVNMEKNMQNKAKAVGGAALSAGAAIATGGTSLAATGALSAAKKNMADKKATADVKSAGESAGAGKSPSQKKTWEKQESYSSPLPNIQQNDSAETSSSSIDNEQTATPRNATSPATSNDSESSETAAVAPAPISRRENREVKKDAKFVRKFNDARIMDSLKTNGYKSNTTSFGAGMSALTSGMYVGARTANSKAAYQATSASIAKSRNAVEQRNAQAVKVVGGHEREAAQMASRRDAVNDKLNKQEANRQERTPVAANAPRTTAPRNESPNRESTPRLPKIEMNDSKQAVNREAQAQAQTVTPRREQRQQESPHISIPRNESPNRESTANRESQAQTVTPRREVRQQETPRLPKIELNDNKSAVNLNDSQRVSKPIASQQSTANRANVQAPDLPVAKPVVKPARKPVPKPVIKPAARGNSAPKVAKVTPSRPPAPSLDEIRAKRNNVVPKPPRR